MRVRIDRTAGMTSNGSRPPATRPDHAARVDVVGVAASTGGPAALVSILASLPRTLPVPVLVVQHIQPGFERGLVSMLDRLSSLRVRLAVHGQAAEAGEVTVVLFVAPARVSVNARSPWKPTRFVMLTVAGAVL